MDIKELIAEAFNTLRVNKLRTFLAVLGIVIGIGSVIALISLGSGSQKAITDSIESLGANLLTVIPGSTKTGFVQGGGSATTLTLADAQAITTSPTVTDVVQVSPEYSGRAQVTGDGNNTNTQVAGALGVYAKVHKINIASGRFLTDNDDARQLKVAVIGPTVASNLFGNSANPLGQSIRIKGQSFKVIGVTASKGGSGLGNQDDVIYVPLSVAQKVLFGSTSLTSISVEAKNSDVMVAAEDQVGYLLLDRHKITDPTNADFSIFSQNDILNTANSITGTFTALLSGIAAISLVVGGIGIMNIMLVTVTERTREIGLRKALGAKRRDIITQFLIESAILTFAGGVVGMIVGILISLVLSKLISIPFVISGGAVALAIGVSTATGIIFGWYPARRAAGLEPIEALRYE